MDPSRCCFYYITAGNLMGRLICIVALLRETRGAGISESISLRLLIKNAKLIVYRYKDLRFQTVCMQNKKRVGWPIGKIFSMAGWLAGPAVGIGSRATVSQVRTSAGGEEDRYPSRRVQQQRQQQQLAQQSAGLRQKQLPRVLAPRDAE